MRVTLRFPELELLASSETKPPVAESLMFTLPAEAAVIEVAFVPETRIVPVVSLTVREAVLSSPPVQLTPVLPSSVMEVLATSPAAELRLILEPVEWRKMLSAVRLESALKAMLFEAVTETDPPTAVACVVAAPRLTSPLLAVRVTEFVPMIFAPAF